MTGDGSGEACVALPDALVSATECMLVVFFLSMESGKERCNSRSQATCHASPGEQENSGTLTGFSFKKRIEKRSATSV